MLTTTFGGVMLECEMGKSFFLIWDLSSRNDASKPDIDAQISDLKAKIN
jgi:hypothetical protein